MRIALLLALLIPAACTSCARPRERTTQSPPADVAVKTSPPAQTSKVNLNEIFPPGGGRELVLNNCTTCHTFVPIVILQMTKEAWARNARDHRGRVTALSDADFKLLYDYLTLNFGPHKPAARLPSELMETWTSY